MHTLKPKLYDMNSWKVRVMFTLTCDYGCSILSPELHICSSGDFNSLQTKNKKGGVMQINNNYGMSYRAFANKDMQNIPRLFWIRLALGLRMK